MLGKKRKGEEGRRENEEKNPACNPSYSSYLDLDDHSFVRQKKNERNELRS